MDEFAEVELGPKMLACNDRERRFVWHFVTSKDDNATEAARRAGYTDNDNGAIKVRAHALMHRDRVIAAIDEVARKEFRTLLMPTIRATRALVDNPKHPDHARTLGSLLSRLGLGERSAVDVNLAGEVTVNHTDQALNDLRILKSMGLSRDALLGIFGFSGLDRYEKMLAATDARPKLIEGKAEEVT